MVLRYQRVEKMQRRIWHLWEFVGFFLGREELGGCRAFVLGSGCRFMPGRAGRCPTHVIWESVAQSVETYTSIPFAIVPVHRRLFFLPLAARIHLTEY